MKRKEKYFLAYRSFSHAETVSQAREKNRLDLKDHMMDVNYKQKFFVLAVSCMHSTGRHSVIRTSRSTPRYAFARIRILRAYYAMFVSRSAAR